MRLKDTGLTVQDIKDKVNKYMIETYERFDFLAETAECQRTDLSGYRNRTRNQSGKYRCEEADPDRYRNDRQEISMIEA